MNKIPELLAPAGSPDALYAAVEGGADAVYFGGRTANARNSAKNFSGEEISHAVKFLHDNGRHAYITLNILHTDRELVGNAFMRSDGSPGSAEMAERINAFPTDLLKFAEDCYVVGADAFIIQDIGLSQIIKKYFPDIKLHASTQAAGHNLYSAQKLAELGFSRMVIARETDRENLEYLIKNSPLEIEMFAHGALCSSHSGRCFMSFALGNTRSANMGTCAQPCRLKYSNGYSLSLKDLCLAGHIKELLELSPVGLKIEGRMKPPEYVYNVCKIYRACLDEKRNADKHEIDFLAKIFSRQGFTDGYFTCKLGISMYGVRTDENKTESREYGTICRGDPCGRPCKNANAELSFRATARVATTDQLILQKSKNIKINPKLCLMFNSFEQFEQVCDFIKSDGIFNRIYRIFLPLENEKIPQEFAGITGVKLPYVIFDSEKEQIINAVKNAGAKSILIDNIGHIDFAQNENLELFGNFGLNVTNSYALDEYRKTGFSDIILSPELNFAQIRDINKSVNCGIVAYGKTHVMISENCLKKNSGSKCCENFYLTDKTGAKFLVQRDGVFSHRNIIYNSVPVYLADKKDLYKNLGLFFVALNFTNENPEQIKKIISDYAINKENIKPPEKFTRGYKNN